VLRVVIFVLLAVDGVISAVVGAIFVQIHLGPAPFPVSALLSGLLNALLVWVGLQWTASGRWAAMAVWTWLLTVAVVMSWGAGGLLATWFGGFFDDMLFGGPGFDQFSPLVLLVLGILPPALVLSPPMRRLRKKRL
jgi:peptidoglycan biosynthesis protein MviN/MurJ (putative lipid II flippase)